METNTWIEVSSLTFEDIMKLPTVFMGYNPIWINDDNTDGIRECSIVDVDEAIEQYDWLSPEWDGVNEYFDRSYDKPEKIFIVPNII